MLRLPNAWVWDFWLADDGQRFHLFFLFASRALGDEHRRHKRASVGHAVSDDLVSWCQLDDALVRSDPPAFDDLATWTGCVVREPEGNRWQMFYTGATEPDGGLLETICRASSEDLKTWDRDASSPVVVADERWYEKLGDPAWREEAWRDPWVFPDPSGSGWHMLTTARANQGAPYDRGVIGHAYSADLREWEVLPPLSQPNAGFAHLEVPQVASVGERLVLLFSCLETELSEARRETGAPGGIWYVPIDSPTGPFDISAARQLTDDSLYCGRLTRDRSDNDVLLGFRYHGPTGEFIGELADPMPVAWKSDELHILDGTT